MISCFETMRSFFDSSPPEPFVHLRVLRFCSSVSQDKYRASDVGCQVHFVAVAAFLHV